MRHLLSGSTIRHVQARVVAVGLRAPHVHRLQQVLAVQHTDLSGRQGFSAFYLAMSIGDVTDGSHLHNDQFVLGAAEIMELLSKTQSHCGIWGRNLTLLVQLQSWSVQKKTNVLRAFAVTDSMALLTRGTRTPKLNPQTHPGETSQCQRSSQQRPSPVCRAWGYTAAPPQPAPSRRLCSGTVV